MSHPAHVMQRFIFYLIFSVFLFESAHAQDIAAAWTYVRETQPLSPTTLLTDSAGQMPITAPFSFGILPEAVWLKTHIAPQTRSSFLWIQNPSLGQLDLYVYDGDNLIKEVHTGSFRPFASRDMYNHAFLFMLPPTPSGKKATLIIRAQSKESLYLPVRLLSYENFQQTLVVDMAIVYIVLGVLGTLFVSYTFIFIFLRHRTYLYYILYALCMFLMVLKFTGLGFCWIWPDHPEINQYLNLTNPLTSIAGSYFSLKFLQIRQHSKALYYTFITLMCGMGLAFPLTFMGYQQAAIILVHAFAFPLMFTCTGSAVWMAIRHRYEPAWYYLMSFPILFAFVIIYICNSVGLLHSLHPFILHSLEIGPACEMLVLGLGVSKVIDRLRQEKEEFQRENMEIIQHQNEMLEREVAVRTEELETQNEELMVQQEELSAQRETIDEQNEFIRDHNRHLEEQISKKTEELRMTNRELVEYNLQLEQFAFVTAHNLRSPVATLLGLTNLLDLAPDTSLSSDTADILRRIRHASQNLDEVIGDLNKILSIKNGHKELQQRIDLDRLFMRVLTSLSGQISRQCCTIEHDFKEAQVLHSFSPYLESILYNLLSNAIKYKSEKRHLKVTVTSSIRNNHVELKVSDNGIGINMQQHGDKIFGLYRRFHDHVQGKGMGLFLVKTQVIVLGGSIHLLSEEDVGTCITIRFPMAILETARQSSDTVSAAS